MCHDIMQPNIKYHNRQHNLSSSILTGLITPSAGTALINGLDIQVHLLLPFLLFFLFVILLLLYFPFPSSPSVPVSPFYFPPFCLHLTLSSLTCSFP